MVPVFSGISDMPGPAFLALYAAVIAATLLGCWLWVRFAGDPTRGAPLPPVPDDPDPYRIAWLRGGTNEVLRLAVFDLHQRGYLRVATRKGWLSTQQVIEQAESAPDPKSLTELERAVYAWFAASRKPADVFRGLPQHVDPWCAEFEREYEQNQLLTTAGTKMTAVVAGLLGAAVILGLGGFKLSAALAKGKTNVQFLIVMGIVGTLVLIGVCRPPRLSSLGRRFMERLQAVFFRLKAEPGGPPEAAAGVNDSLLLATALFGVGALATTQYAYFGDMFKTATHSSSTGSTSGGCGAGCGAACGGGCGGGCGGCGGCGG